MKKKIVLSFMVILVIFCCSACNGSVTRTLRHDGFTYGAEFTCDNFFPKDKDDTSYEKIKYLTSTHIVNDKGKIYEISLSQQYSNKSNCKPAETNIEVVAIFDDNVIKASDGKYYYLATNNNTVAYSEVTNQDKNYFVYDLLLNPEGTIKVVTADDNAGLYYVLKNDGNVYGFTVSQNDRKAPPSVSNITIAYNKNNYGGDIIDFNFAGNSSATYVRTKDKIYKMIAENADECKKYADVQCNYKMKESDSYNEYKDYYLAYNGHMVITTYGRIFNA